LVCLHWSIIRLFSGEITKPICFHRKLHREAKTPFGNIHFSHRIQLEKYQLSFFLSIILVIKHFCFSFRSNINLYFPFNLSWYIVSTSILVMYYILTWPQNRGVEDVNNHFQKCSMKVTFRKRNLKKNHLFIQIIYWKIYTKKIQTLISPYIKPPKTSSVKREQTKHVFAVHK
jgi:hypothetical protein